MRQNVSVIYGLPFIEPNKGHIYQQCDDALQLVSSSATHSPILGICCQTILKLFVSHSIRNDAMMDYLPRFLWKYAFLARANIDVYRASGSMEGT